MGNSNNQHWNRKAQIIWKITLFFGSIFVYCTRSTISVCAVRIGQELGWDKRISGFVMSTFFFGYVLTQIAGGVLADKFGGDQTIFLAACVWSSCTFATAFMGRFLFLPETFGIGIVQFFAGIAQGVHFPSLASLVSIKIPEDKRNSAFGFITSGTNIGSLFTGSIGSILLEYFGWRAVFVVFGTISLFWAIVVRFLMTVEKIQKDFVDNNNIDNNGDNNSDMELVKEDKGKTNWRKVLTCLPFWALFITSSLESFVFTTLSSWLPTYFHEVYPKSKPWVYNVLPWVANFISSNIAGIISDRMISAGVSVTKLRKGMVCTALFASTILCYILTHVKSYDTSLVLVTSLCFFVGLNTCGVGMNPQDLMPDNSGLLYGIMNTASAIAGMVGVSLMGQLLHETQNWSNSFIAISISGFVGGIIFLFFGSGERIS